MGSQGSLMRIEREVWSDPKDELLLLKLLKYAGSDKKVSEYTVHCNLLCIGLNSCRPVRLPILTPIHRQKRQ